MENSTPLLTQSTSSSQDQLNNPTIDELIELSLETFGVTQIVQSILVSQAVVFDSQQALISDFTDAEPSWHCTSATTTCNSSSNICDLSKDAWSWDVSSHQTIVSEWNLECESSLLTGLPATSFFLGCLVGGFIFGVLGDSNLGRKNMLFFSCFSMSMAAAATAFANNIWVYSILRFITGCFRASVLTSALVLLTEMVGKKRRGLVSIIAFIFFTLGTLTLTAIAYLNRTRSWRFVYVWTSVPGILYCIVVYFLVCESPRWLLVHGRNVEALKALKRLSTLSHQRLQEYMNYLSDSPVIIPVSVVGGIHTSIKNLLKRRWAIKRLLWMMVLGFGTGMLYYGILIGVGDLNFNTYFSVTLNALLDFPAYLILFILIETWKRRASILVLCILSGLFSIVCAFTSNGPTILQVGSELSSLLCICVITNVLSVYATELFPTTVRNGATSMVRLAKNLGASISPLLVSVGRKNLISSYGVFGVVILVCGFFVICLPETRGMPLCDTLDQQEKKHDIDVLA